MITKFNIPDLSGVPKFLVESVASEYTTLMGIEGKVYYCLGIDDRDIFSALSLRIQEAKYSMDRIKYSEAVVIEHDGKWTVIKSRYGKTNIDIYPVGYVPPPVVKTTKAFLFEILVIDHEGHGIRNAEINIENCRYVNPTIVSRKTADIGEWTDEHPLNYRKTPKSEILKYFEEEEEWLK